MKCPSFLLLSLLIPVIIGTTSSDLNNTPGQTWTCKNVATPWDCYSDLTNQLSARINSPACQGQSGLIELPPPERRQLQRRKSFPGTVVPYQQWTGAMNEMAQKILYEAYQACRVDFYRLFTLASMMAGYANRSIFNNQASMMTGEAEDMANTLQHILSLSPNK